MTAVATQSTFQSGLSRNGWSSPNAGQLNLNAMTPEEVSRMFVLRKGVQRTNSSSSVSSVSSASSTSSNSTVTSASNQSNGVQHGETSGPSRKKAARNLWPSSKAEPVAGLSTARPQSVSAIASGPSAASAISALHNPSQPMVQSQIQGNGNARGHAPYDGHAILHLLPVNGTFDRKVISVPTLPDVQRIGRQTNAKTQPTSSNGYFDSKVLSRQHAEIWAEKDGKIWIRDVKSSNGTFVNGKRLSQENRDSEPHSLKEHDILELGIDIVSEDQKTVVHHKVAARVEHAGFYGTGNNSPDINFNDLDPSAASNAPNMGHNARSRTASQGSMPSGSRYGHGIANHVAAHHAKWLQPVTMEQIVKRLHTELRQARIQGQDLSYTGNYVDALLSKENPPPPPQSRKMSSPTKSSDAKARISEPPAPPPSQPLPEKPDAAVRSKLPEFPALQPLLRRSDTEKPRLLSTENEKDLSSTSDSGSQVLSLVEALNTAQSEIASYSDRLLYMEDALKTEREARTSAEERAERLQSGFLGSSSAVRDMNSVHDSSESWTRDISDPGSSLSDRLELMRTEMDNTRLEMERYRQRAEAAEQRNETLEEMIAKIRRREDAAQKRRAMRSRAKEQGSKGDSLAEKLAKDNDGTSDDHGGVNGVQSEDDDDTLFNEDIQVDDALLNGQQKALSLRKHRPPTSEGHEKDPSQLIAWTMDLMRNMSGAQLGELSAAVKGAEEALSSPNGHHDAADNETAVVPASKKGPTTTRGHLAHSAPYASILGVVILGVGLMSYLNGWSKIGVSSGLGER